MLLFECEMNALDDTGARLSDMIEFSSFWKIFEIYDNCIETTLCHTDSRYSAVIWIFTTL